MMSPVRPPSLSTREKGAPKLPSFRAGEKGILSPPEERVSITAFLGGGIKSVFFFRRRKEYSGTVWAGPLPSENHDAQRLSFAFFFPPPPPFSFPVWSSQTNPPTEHLEAALLWAARLLFLPSLFPRRLRQYVRLAENVFRAIVVRFFPSLPFWSEVATQPEKVPNPWGVIAHLGWAFPLFLFFPFRPSSGRVNGGLRTHPVPPVERRVSPLLLFSFPFFFFFFPSPHSVLWQKEPWRACDRNEKMSICGLDGLLDCPLLSPVGTTTTIR